MSSSIYSRYVCSGNAGTIALACLLLSALGLETAAGARSSNSTSSAYNAWADHDWPIVGGDWNNTRYSLLSQIDPNTIHTLAATWISPKFHDGATSRSPLVVKDGSVFATAGRHVYALDARTGQVLWTYNSIAETRSHQFKPMYNNAESMPDLPNGVPNGKGVGVGEGLVFVGLMNGQVIALGQLDGKLKWANQIGISQPKRGQLAAVAPTYANGVVFAGLSDGDHNLRGRMVALDAKTGKHRWSMFAVPGPGEPGHDTWPSSNETWKVGGGGVWTNPPVDPELGLVYFTAGNAVPAYAGDWRPGANLYTCSVLAVDIRTGKLQWYFQLIHHDVFEADLGVPIILYDEVGGGRARKALAVMRADGHLFHLDRATGQPIIPIEEIPVPQSTSQKTWPTQPFPVGGESILMGCDEWRTQVPKGFALGCMFTPPASPPPSPEPQNVLTPFPSVKGSLMAFSPKTGFFYAQASSSLHWPRRSQDAYFLNWVGVVPGLRNYAELVAIDGRSGRIAWRQRKPNSPAGSGPLVTAANVLFHSSGDGSLHAYNATSGDLLWQFPLGTVAGPAATYEMDDEQYVAATAGSSVWAFKLGGKIARSTSRLSETRDDEFPAPLVDAEEIETTTLHRSLITPGARYFVDEFTFNPSRARVKAGARVLFVNNGSMHHEIVSIDGSWTTGSIGPTQQSWLMFDKAGIYTYICKVHPWSYGQIVVSPGSPSNAQSSSSQDPRAPTTSQPSDLQRMQGRDQFNRHCSSCHGEDLSGRASAPPLIGSSFVSRWGAASARDLFDNVRATMPQASPGSLDRQTYLDIVAYLLGANHVAVPETGLRDDAKMLGDTQLSQPRDR